MQIFHCDHCQNIVYIENDRCFACNSVLGFLPDVGTMSVLTKQGDGSFLAAAVAAGNRRYRLCQNDSSHGICNWAVPVTDDHALCISCRLTQAIPNLSLAGNLQCWGRLEQVKRRLLYNLMRLCLPIVSREEDPLGGLAFEFLDDPAPGEPVVRTGHLSGVVTIHIAEASDEERERRRLNLREPYRTLLGHFRHEAGHYYWDRLIRDGGRLQSFRELFGDDTTDYLTALHQHYQNGPPADWLSRHVTAYASAHPLEDWAETWAHYFHIFHTLDTASSCGVQLKPPRADDPHLDLAEQSPPLDWSNFDQLIDNWIPLTYLLNSLTRSLGQNDVYPFVLKPKAIEKLRYVHECIAGFQQTGR